MRGSQGAAGEIFLDLERPLEGSLKRRFDVVFNHTTLEHIYDFRLALRNLCELSRDIVILVVPFLQEHHEIVGEFGDYWRFSPSAVERLFEENSFSMIYQHYNDESSASVYTFSIASRTPENWPDAVDWQPNAQDSGRSRSGSPIGGRAIPNHRYRVGKQISRVLSPTTRAIRRLFPES